MDDYEKFVEEIDSATNHLNGLGVPDPDLDELVYQAAELLKQARDKAAGRTEAVN